MNEAETRTEHIDPALKGGGPGCGCKDAGRGVVEDSRIPREYPITRGRLEGHGRGGDCGLAKNASRTARIGPGGAGDCSHG
jgi:hypothetical protein